MASKMEMNRMLKKFRAQYFCGDNCKWGKRTCASDGHRRMIRFLNSFSIRRCWAVALARA